MKYSEFKKHYVIKGEKVVKEFTSSFNDGLDDMPGTSKEFDKHMYRIDLDATFYTVIDPMYRIVKSRIDSSPLEHLTYVDLVDEIAAFSDDDFDFTITEETVGDTSDEWNDE